MRNFHVLYQEINSSLQNNSTYKLSLPVTITNGKQIFIDDFSKFFHLEMYCIHHLQMKILQEICHERPILISSGGFGTSDKNVPEISIIERTQFHIFERMTIAQFILD